MIRLRTIVRPLAALFCLGAAALLLARSGLPDRIELGSSVKVSGGGLQIGSPAPRFQLKNAAGEQVALYSEPGVFSLINFWATWCAPCRRELRELQQLQNDRTDTIRVLAINMGESADRVAAWQAEIGLTYDLLLDPTLAVSRQFLVRGLPTSYLLDSKLRFRAIYYGPVTGAQLERDIRRLAQRA